MGIYKSKGDKVMRDTVLAVIFPALFLSGCAAVHRSQGLANQDFQARISYLEAEIERKNRQISILEDDLAMSQSSSEPLVKEDRPASRLSARQIQAALKNAGFYKGAVDGHLGPRTKEAIRNFQKANGLYADGVAGKQTREKLKRYLD